MEERLGHGARREDRHALVCPLQVSWQVTSRETRTVRATCLDVSAHGACIECSQAIGARTNVYLQAPSLGLMGNASVRYCRPHGPRYRIGLEFTWAAALAEAGRKNALRNAVG
jgi:hypothetical protein